MTAPPPPLTLLPLTLFIPRLDTIPATPALGDTKTGAVADKESGFR